MTASSPLITLFLSTFNQVEDKVKSFDPKLCATLWLRCTRKYDGNLDLDVDVYNDYSNDRVTGKDVDVTLEEFLRRKGFEESQSKLLLEPPSIDG